MSIDYTTQESEGISKARVEQLVENYASSTASDLSTSSNSTSPLKSRPISNTRSPATPLWKQTQILVHRTGLCLFRDQYQFLGNLINALVLGIVVGGIYFRTGEDNSQAGIKSRQGMLYPFCLNQHTWRWVQLGTVPLQFNSMRFWYTTRTNVWVRFIYLANLPVVIKELRIFDFEHEDGMYSIHAYVMAQITSNLLGDLLTGFIYSAVTYYMASLRGGDSGGYFGVSKQIVWHTWFDFERYILLWL